MTNDELNAYLDKTCFGVDQAQKMCGLAISDPAYDGQCTKATRPDYHSLRKWHYGVSRQSRRPFVHIRLR